jgi:beta-lactamase class A
MPFAMKFSPSSTLSLLCLMSVHFLHAQNQDEDRDWRNQISNIVQGQKADIGVAVAGIGLPFTTEVNGSRPFTTMSVVKLPLAVAILHRVDKGELTLSQPLSFSASDLRPGTHSPMRDAGPREGFELPLKDVLMYSAGMSDNIACDKLFEVMGGPKKTTEYLKKLGCTGMDFGIDYAHTTKENIGKNSSTPNGMADLLVKFHLGEILSPESRAVLWKIMVETDTGPNRLKGMLPAGTVVAHKTGTFYEGDKSTFCEAINDVGIVQLPNGKHYAIAVFVNNAHLTPEATSAIIAQINKVAWDHFSKL